MQKRNIIVLVIAVLIIGNLLQFAHNYSILPRNAVPDAETAIKIAQAAFSEYLEPKNIQPTLYWTPVEVRPVYPLRPAEYLYWGFETTFNRLRGVWIVSAYLQLPEDVLVHHRTPEATIRMRDAKIMNFRMR